MASLDAGCFERVNCCLGVEDQLLIARSMNRYRITRRSFGLGTSKARDVLSCFLNGTTEDDIRMGSTPAYIKPL